MKIICLVLRRPSSLESWFSRKPKKLWAFCTLNQSHNAQLGYTALWLVEGSWCSGKLGFPKAMLYYPMLWITCDPKSHSPANAVNWAKWFMYRTRTILTCCWFETALDLKPLLIINSGFYRRLFCLVNKLSLISTALDYKPKWKKG
jgi:hypothetical protein